MTSLSAAQATTPKRAPKMASQVNLNHLLNFTLPPRQSQTPSSVPRRSRRTGGTHHGVWNKERFVNAQYRFVMNPMGDYTVHFADPDIFFQWNDIVQVIIPRSSPLAAATSGGGDSDRGGEGHRTCPICLSPPTASRMTKCGHVFCYPCILHYLSTSDNKWARCPICFDSVNDKQLKSVKWFDGPTFEPAEDNGGASSSASSSSILDNSFEAPLAGLTMRLRLMQRPQITTLTLPRSSTWPSELIPPHQAPFHFLPDVFNYSKFMLATPDYLVSDLTRDLNELAMERRTLAGMNDNLGVSFIDRAELKVKNQIARVMAMDNPVLLEQIDKARAGLRELEERRDLHLRRQAEQANTPRDSDIPQELLALGPNSFPSTPVPDTPKPKAAPKQRRNVNPPPPSTSTYYYYQAASGFPLFLHPLDIRILLSHFKSYPLFPDTIDIRIEALSEGSVNDDLRKRCKYLAHMPEGADVVFIEADLKSVVGSEGLKNFEGALRMRTSRRKEKGKKDDRARARAEERERERRMQHSFTTWTSPSAISSTTISVEPAPPEHDEIPSPPQEPAFPGAWGSRSFASAVHSSPSRDLSAQDHIRRDDEDEWDLDVAWHELEQRNNGGAGGRRKKNNKLVILGGGGRRR
ncbi:uncharacterized protein BT62DRAFT_926410 [Guyanagaster necrorhizus]|uniref:RING-type domain-containing protein n=1 Tax=Guyanagaster necrorhizus TaxID=856835 RepID=A0A9P7W439_9AGAR|nr:uncharacterized protein BT62DRAFT_926410 [Guyanagaster necrorhizus MCA 3950]KAG7452199.1 hypothetical protein BT62DRAFT_926410 [Guyanagaster necrorhizus MCA 3950]